MSSGLTFMALQTQSARLKGHLRELPPPGIDAEAWAQHVLDTTPAGGKQLVADGVQKTMKGKAQVVMVGAKSAVSGIAEGATGIAGGVKQRLRKGK